MMRGIAFSSLYNLKLKIEYHLKPSGNSLNSKSREIFKIVYKHLESFEEVAKATLNTDLDVAISRHVRELEKTAVDPIESKKYSFLKPIGSKCEEINEDEIRNQLMEIIHLFEPQLKVMMEKVNDGIYVSFLDKEDDHNIVSSEVIGVREVYEQLKDKLMSPQQVTSLVGMPGIGKTTLATKLFNDSTIVESFDHRLWIQLGKKYRAKDIPRRMLEEMHTDGLQMLPEGDEEAVREQLNARLKGERYLIVLDDVWDRFTMHLLCPADNWFHLDQPFFHPESRSRVLITSRLQQIDEYHQRKDMIPMRLLNREESWYLFRERVFPQGSCPPQLVKAGKKISDNCEGLPLTILALARLLSQKEEKSNLEYWEEVAAKQNHQIFLNAYDEISKVLLPSYTYLPPILKMCFMFIGLFPPKYEVPRSKLINLWLADGFLELNVHISIVENALELLEELVFNSLIMVYQQSSYDSKYNVKTCGLHSSLWHLSKKKAMETKFALLLSTLNDGIGDGIEVYRRLSFQNNVLFAIKDVHKSVEDNCASAARSLFCFGPYHRYQVPLCFGLKFLTELDALSVRLYEFPMEVYN